MHLLTYKPHYKIDFQVQIEWNATYTQNYLGYTAKYEYAACYN